MGKSQINNWDTCESVWSLGLLCRHGKHHPECVFYTKSQNTKYKDKWVRYCPEPIPLSQLDVDDVLSQNIDEEE